MWWYDLLAIFSLQAIALLDACPTKCQCIGQARVSVYCDFRGLEEVPSNIPVATTYLDFSGNKFTKVVPEMFLGHANDSDGVFFAQKVPLEQLEVILQHGRRLDLNPLDTVSEHALDTTPSLEFIYLPFDIKIQRQAFVQMKTDKLTFDGYNRVVHHPLENPHFVAFSRDAT